MKLIAYIILLSPFSALTQAWQLDSVKFEGETYLHYPLNKVVGTYSGVRIWMCDTNLYCSGLPKAGRWIQFFEKDTTQPARIWEYKNESFDGFWYEFYLNGQIKDSGIYVSNRKQGPWKSYYENGQLKSLHTYQNGENSGKWIVYFESGNIDREGISDSIHIEYFENGLKKIEYEYFGYGQRNSEWFSNGQLQYAQVYISGKLKDTIQTYYYSNGQVKKSGRTENGAFIGFWNQYHENGQVSSCGEYKTFKSMSTDFVPSIRYLSYPTGEWKYYYPTGKLMARGTYGTYPVISTPGEFAQHKVEPFKNNDWIYYDELGNPTTYDEIKELIR